MFLLGVGAITLVAISEVDGESRFLARYPDRATRLRLARNLFKLQLRFDPRIRDRQVWEMPHLNVQSAILQQKARRARTRSSKERRRDRAYNNTQDIMQRQTDAE